MEDRFRQLPSVSALLTEAEALGLHERFGRPALTWALRIVLDGHRDELQDGASAAPDRSAVLEEARLLLARQESSTIQPVFNLTGTILHTNLGRALLADTAIDAAVQAMREPVTLEFDLASGSRGERDDHVRALLCELTGAADALVVNNNAAALLLCLNTLAQGRGAIVSRGELIEIGGAFRLPEIMARAGALLIEVGTTNRTHLHDYENALNPSTGLLLKVHTSNYRIQGFTSEVSAKQLAGLAATANVPLVHDLGSGNLVDLSAFGLKKELTAREAVAHGANLVTFSGDKLLGGPQAGLIVGDSALIAKVRENPLRRALRMDKIRLAALEATLKLYRDPGRLAERLPTMKLLTRSRHEIRSMAERLLTAVQGTLGTGFAVEVCECESEVGSGALPLDTIPSAGLLIRPAAGRGGLEMLAHALRTASRPILGRIAGGGLILDLRGLSDEGAFLNVLSKLQPHVLRREAQEDG
jgi:L-seryl-tRNA(Ser) seleniumtransferase